MAGIRDKVARWTRDGMPFELIEQRISRLPASEEDKSALWMWAWSYRSAHGRRSAYGPRRVLPTNGALHAKSGANPWEHAPVQSRQLGGRREWLQLDPDNGR